MEPQPRYTGIRGHECIPHSSLEKNIPLHQGIQNLLKLRIASWGAMTLTSKIYVLFFTIEDRVEYINSEKISHTNVLYGAALYGNQRA